MGSKNLPVIFKLLSIFLSCTIILFCVLKWNTWFHNPTEPHYLSSEDPVNIQLTFGNDGHFSRNVSWQCGDTLATSQLFIVKSTSFDTISVAAEGKIIYTTGGTTVTYHTKLTGLSEGEYSYCVCTGDKQSAWYNFNISAGDNFRFIYIGDIQDTIGGTAKEFFTAINRCEKDVAFWILGGDVVERPQDRYWKEYFTSMDSISQNTPIIACPGNHEYFKGIFAKLDERFIYNFSYLADRHNNDYAVFDTRFGNTAIFTLDSNRSAYSIFSQSLWFKQALQKAQDAKWKIVVIHHPVYSVRGKFRHLLIRYLLNPLIREFGVDIVLQGHEHCYARMINKDKNKSSTTPIYLISQSSPKDYEIKIDKKYDRFGNGLRFYQTIDISADTLSLKAFTEKGELYDHVLIVKSNDNLNLIDLATNIPEQFIINSLRNQ